MIRILVSSVCANHQFYTNICVEVTQEANDGNNGIGPGIPVETPLPHPPGVRMTVVELTPSNDHETLAHKAE